MAVAMKVAKIVANEVVKKGKVLKEAALMLQ